MQSFPITRAFSSRNERLKGYSFSMRLFLKIQITYLSKEYFIMKFEAVTIKDIARELNPSTSTVSRTLRDSYEISAETKKMVLERAERLHYTPNPIVLSLKEKRS